MSFSTMPLTACNGLSSASRLIQKSFIPVQSRIVFPAKAGIQNAWTRIIVRDDDAAAIALTDAR